MTKFIARIIIMTLGLIVGIFVVLCLTIGNYQLFTNFNGPPTIFDIPAFFLDLPVAVLGIIGIFKGIIYLFEKADW